jgi:putative membrane protein
MDRSSRSLALIAGLLAAGWLIACADEATPGEETAAVGSAEIRDPGAAGEIARVPEDAGPDLSDANIFALLDHANQADSAAGYVAESKGTHRLVRQYARRMMADHHRLRLQGLALARKLDVTRQPPPEDPITPLAREEMNALNSAKKGEALDRAYLEQEIEAHQSVLQLTEQCLRSVGNAELRAMLEEARPLIRAHLREAREILGALGDTA